MKFRVEVICLHEDGVEDLQAVAERMEEELGDKRQPNLFEFRRTMTSSRCRTVL